MEIAPSNKFSSRFSHNLVHSHSPIASATITFSQVKKTVAKSSHTPTIWAIFFTSWKRNCTPPSNILAATITLHKCCTPSKNLGSLIEFIEILYAPRMLYDFSQRCVNNIGYIYASWC